ncbi:MAG TPA: phenylacetate--CoA ligase family protein [Candidatus Limnocylindria bacterium]
MTLAQSNPTVATRARWRPGAMTLAAADAALRLLGRGYGSMRWTLERTPPSVAASLSEARALRTAHDAARRVPAYRDHLVAHAIDPEHIRGLADLPETDKASYIDPNPLASRCVDGRIPLVGSTIDESSGSTGMPYNWVRGADERDHVRRMIGFFARYSFGEEPLVVLNAFSMGAWATGLTTAAALEANGLVKATGPHIDKIVGVMTELGPEYRYLIVGYPPFLKLLLDEGEAQGFDWSPYTMHALMGGEGNSEGLRDYLLRHFRTVVSGYGATDVEIGLAAETPVTVALRRLALERREIAEALFGERDRVPMVFQYNPLLHHIETNARGELLFTVCRSSTLSPKVRYNVHDEGGVLRDDELRARLEPFGITPEHLSPPGFGRLVRMPYLFVFGRADSTISVMGANIYPGDVEGGIYADPALASKVRSFRLSLAEERPGETRPRIDVELERDAPDATLEGALAATIEAHLLATNTDYREAAGEYPEMMVPIVRLHAAGTGPFVGDADRIKHRYVG